MKIVLISDSHGKKQKVLDCLQKETYDIVVFAGDGLKDVEQLDDGRCIKVAGNCDIFWNDYPLSTIKDFDGVKTFITHGHKYMAKFGLFGLINEAKQNKCSLVLFGHTHSKLCTKEDGITLVNGGSIANGSYALIEIKDGKIITELKTLD